MQTGTLRAYELGMHAIKTSKASLRSSPTWLADLDLGPDLWSPDARWLAPSVEDKARARAAVEAADRAVAEEAALWDERLLVARQRDVPVVADYCTAPKRTWLDVVGCALCLAPVAGLAVWIVRLVG